MTRASEIDRIAVIAGSGRYPELLLDELIRRGAAVCVLTLPGFDPGGKFSRWIRGPVSLGTYQRRLSALRADGYRRLVFAGAARRPSSGRQGPADSLPEGAADILRGDDSVLRSIAGLAEKAGFEVIGGHDLLPQLAPSSGVLTRREPSESERRDVERAAHIVRAVGSADIGQAAVVVCRLCVAVETVSGTDAMLEFAARTIGAVNPMPGIERGILFKGPKPRQELRLDMPAIGPDTVRRAAEAGLSGIAIKARQVLVLDREDTLAEADRRQIFIWAMDPRC